ncbi:multiple epidermal growth factor-like domains protein 8 [Dreissena polymorpha]|uniref:multiple epidermal growth factor-like domains protein 8 n=1 Tax=Dreissena polymorpha TaxID=45954 RepID=UPI002263ED61|nr:multiple epidermal growth factor-like domains protein 8 [Dreissena polymorpha]
MRRSIAILVFVYHLSVCNGSCKHGRTILTNETGVISDGENTTTYPSYARCEWLIDAKHPNKSIYLEFEFIDTECSYDFLFVFDGDSYLSPTLASLSGQHRPGPIVAKSGKMLVYLFSDRNYERTGFRASYSMQDCPFNCTGHGNCIGHQCYCFMGRTGNYCQLEECPQNCSSHGACVMKDDNSTYKCQCEKGYAGYMCNISLNNSEGSELWYTLLPEGMGLEPRSAHAGAFVSRTECLYVFGGFSLNEVLSDLNCYCINETTWNSINRSEPWPKGRYEHAIELFEDGFYMFGGMLDDGNYSDELWFFNVTSETWTLCANESVFKPLQLSGHTLTRVEDNLYVFGGKTKDGLFWSNIYKINGHIPTEWQEVLPLAGKSSARRLVGHSTVYHKESKSLLIYGGYSHNADEPRYGSHKDELHLFHVENKIWSKIKTNEALDNGPAPSQRSFHSANIMGNYMVVFGGNTHIHHDVEKCYDYEIYLYHLGCHIWVKAELLMGKYSSALDDGRVSHVAAVAYGNTLLVAGGYAGYVKGDVMAFKFPPLIAPPSSEVSLDLDYCTNITLADKCQSNPDCLLCTKQGRCMHRTHITEQLCGPLKTGVPYMQCPGICSRLSSCVSCLSQGQGAARSQDSPEHWTYIQPCNWCVKEGECQLRSKPTGNCAAATSTSSGLVGWWGDKSLSLSQIAQCRLEDKPAGLVSILRQTNMAEKYRRIYTRPLLKSFTRWRGWIHPLNATVKHLIDPSPKQFMLKLAVDNIAVKVWLNKDAIVGRKERIMNIGIGDNPLELKSRADNSLLFPNTSPGTRYYLDIEGEYLYPSSTNSQPAINEKLYSIELKWDGSATNGNSLSVLHAFSFEFLEPYSVGDCANFTSCLACMTDTACGWCDVEARCMPRNTSTSACAKEGHQLMITEPSVCTVCDDHVECLSCAKDPHCEWVKDKVHCIRRGRGLDTEIAAIPEQCPASCHELSSCSQCLNVGECAWCESLRSCLPFYDYVIRHRHGQCTEWVDSEITRNDNTYSCRNCSILKSCESCMKSFNCGWCGNRANPKKGVCFEGDFAGTITWPKITASNSPT